MCAGEGGLPCPSVVMVGRMKSRINNNTVQYIVKARAMILVPI